MLPLPRAAAHAFVTDLSEPVLAEEDRRHLDRVLRLRPGETVTVSDGAGGWRSCRWLRSGQIEAAGPATTEERPSPTVTVALALTKGDRPEWAVQKLTEVGVDAITVFRAARSVVRWDDAKAAEQVRRWRKVAREAAMQSRRVWLPRIEELVGFPGVVHRLGDGAALAAPGGSQPSLDRPATLVGPEGGWSEEEVGCGLPLVSLGPTVLRSETAALAAGVILCGLRAGTIRAMTPGVD